MSVISFAKKMDQVEIPRNADGRVVSDQRGRIAVWHNAKKAWIWRQPIDARELVAMGVATFEPADGAPPRPLPQAIHVDATGHDDEDGEVRTASSRTNTGAPR